MKTDMDTGGGAVALVSQGEAIMRIENDSLMQVAIQRPRDETKVLDGALKELEMVPEEAAASYYSIPYRDRESGQQQMVEGPSIGAAMALARRWGNCSVGARVLAEDATGITVEGCFIDFESSFRVLRPHRVSRFLKRRNGQVMELSPDRLLMATQAGASKALRNAILAGLPKYLVNTYYKRAKQLVAGGKLDERPTPAEIDKAMRAFAPYNVTPEQLEAAVELPRASWTRETIATLRGFYAAIKDGQTTVEEVFGGRSESEAKPPAKPAGSALDQVADAMAPGRGGPGALTPVGEFLAALDRLREPLDLVQRQALFLVLFETDDLTRVDAAALADATLLAKRAGEGDAEAQRTIDGFLKRKPRGK